jgi:di-N-acetylchitobiase
LLFFSVSDFQIFGLVRASTAAVVVLNPCLRLHCSGLKSDMTNLHRAGCWQLCAAAAALLLVSVAATAPPRTFPPNPAPRACPCADASLCRPVVGPPRREVFAFQAIPQNWRAYDWSRVTTVALYSGLNDDNAAMLCYAHSVGVRVVHMTAWTWQFMPLENLANKTIRDLWVAYTVAQVVGSHLDGVNVDIEQPAKAGGAVATGIALLMEELAVALRPRIEGGGQISFDAASQVAGTGRGYPYARIAAACDFLVIMDYDLCCAQNGTATAAEQRCAAGPNAPADTALAGVAQFLAVHDVPFAFVLAVSWDGFSYRCNAGTSPTAERCPMPAVGPYGGKWYCDDSTGAELGYGVLRGMAANASVQPFTAWQRTTAWRRNATLRGNGSWATFNFVNASAAPPVVYQAWLDTPATLAPKYRFARERGLRGVGLWTVDSVSWGAPQLPAVWRDARDMWVALDAFRDGA